MSNITITYPMALVPNMTIIGVWRGAARVLRVVTIIGVRCGAARILRVVTIVGVRRGAKARGRANRHDPDNPSKS